MPTPAKNTATIISIAMPFCGDLELTPHSCLSKSSWSRWSTTIICVTAIFVVVGAWTVNLVSYHPATDLNPLAPLGTNVDWK